MDRPNTKPHPVKSSSRQDELDDEELQIEKDLVAGLYKKDKNSTKNIKEMRKIAVKMTTKKPITFRVSDTTLQQLKEKAFIAGLPYQTLISSILHRFVTGQFKEND
jgi:predicted DNA binding CopG/RHH family protein